MHESLKDALARQSRLSATKELDARGAQSCCDGRLDAIVKGSHMVALRSRDGLEVVAKRVHLQLRALWTVPNAVIDRGSEHHERSAEGALHAEAKLRTKKDAQGVLKTEEEMPNRLVLLACEESHTALIVVRELLDSPPDEGQPVLLVLNL